VAPVRTVVTGGTTKIGEACGGDGLPERSRVGEALDKWHECPSYRLATRGGKKAVRATLVHGCAAMANGTRGATHRGESSLGELKRWLWILNYSSEVGGMPWR
jgi:hypothetical protein